jgi:tRNA pseudouridine65 synthase
MPAASPPPPPLLTTLWQGVDIVVVDKPPGLLVHNSAWAGPRETTLTELARDALGLPVVPLHRLDRGTSGCVAFAFAADVAAVAAARLGAPKAYLAVVRGHLREAIDVEHPLDDDDVKGSPRKEARSRLVPVTSSPIERVSLVVATLWTGRRHQARRHCKHVSHPIIGDATHGKGPLNRDLAARFGLSRLCLHAWQLGVDDVIVESPLPADWRAALHTLFPGVDVAAAARTALQVDGATNRPVSPDGDEVGVKT